MSRRQTARHATNLWCPVDSKVSRVLSERIERGTKNVALTCQRVDGNVSTVEVSVRRACYMEVQEPCGHMCHTRCCCCVQPSSSDINCITVSMESVSLPKVSVLHTSLEFKANLVIVSFSAGGSSLLVLLAVLRFFFCQNGK